MDAPAGAAESVARSRSRGTALAIAWGLLLFAGFAGLARHQAVAVVPGVAPDAWPAESRILPRPAAANLVLALHPQCPCSRASVAELARALADGRADMAVHVLVWRPRGAAPDWSATSVVAEARRLPGALLQDDQDGAEARRFGATASGHVLLYSSERRLRFSGGVTAARGHEGGNASSDALRRRLASPSGDYCETPVFGCPFAAPARAPELARSP